MKTTKLLFTLSISSLLLLSGCARQISPGVYHGAQVGEVSKTLSAVIVSARSVMVQEDEFLEDNAAGGVLGGVAGGAIGSNLGKGKGRAVGTVAGALVGAIGGAFAERELKKQQAMEYVVQLSNGEMRTIVQGPTPTLHVGQKVFLMYGQKGRSRIQSQ